jgi:hypothetical protein
MRDNWLLWQYRDDNNCWDFVRAILTKEFNVPLDAVPKFGICPSDKTSMTSAYQAVKQGFKRIKQPVDGAVACHFHGRTLVHVGVVMDGKVYHASSHSGTRKNSIKTFSRISTTGYYQWQN